MMFSSHRCRTGTNMMKTKAKAGITDLHIIMGGVHALVDMFLPPDEFGDIAMTPAILDQITAIQNAASDALGRACRLFRLLNRPQAKGIIPMTEHVPTPEDDALEATIGRLFYDLDD